MEKFKPYTQHGVELTPQGSQGVGDCPYCHKENHFYVSVNTGQYDCKSCGEKGNTFTFLNKLHAMAMESTTKQDYERLSKQKKIPVAALRHHKLAVHPILDQWIIPTFNSKNKLCNIHIYDESKNRLLGTATLKQSLFSLQKIGKAKIVWLCEGHWDAMALQHVLLKQKKNSEVAIAAPGASVFNPAWFEHLHDKDLRVCFDNDSAGEKGVARILKLLSESSYKPRRVGQLIWPDGTPDKFDVKDQINSNKKDPYKSVRQLLKKPKVTDGMVIDNHIEPLKRTTFKSVVEDFEANLYFTRSMRDTLAVMLSVVISVRLKGDPLWIYVVGPPSSGKSTLAQAMDGSTQWVRSISKLTATTLVNGWKSADGKDHSLLPKLNKKTLVIKDFTTTLTLPVATQETLYGTLRDAYDGAYSQSFGNAVDRDYAGFQFAMIACCTDEIRSSNRAALGERFLTIEILDGKHNNSKHMDCAIENTINYITTGLEEDRKEESKIAPSEVTKLKRSVLGFLQHLDQTLLEQSPPKVSDWVKVRIAALAQVIGQIRAQVKREGTSNDLSYRPRAEIGLRLAGQLVKLAIAIALVLNKPEVDKHVYSIIQKVALDTVRGWNFEIIEAIANSDYQSLSAKQVANRLGISTSSAERKLANLRELKLVTKKGTPNNSGVRGRYVHKWSLSKRFCELWDKSEISK